MTALERVSRSPLTFEQEAIWIAEQFMRAPSPFLETWAQRITGPLEVPALERALTRLVDRHPTFRTRFELEGNAAVQLIDRGAVVPLERLAWPGGDLLAGLARAGQRPLNLEVSPVRLTLFELGPQDHALLLQIHHIAVDDVSLTLLDDELSALYTEQVGGAAADLPPPGPSLGEYAVRQRAAGVGADSLAFWTDHLDGAHALEHLPPRPRPLPTQRGSGSAIVRGTIPQATGRALRLTAKSLRMTPTVLLSACMALVLAHADGTDDVVIGTPVSRRGDPELDGVFGCLTDLMPVRYRVPGDLTLGETCTLAKKTGLAALRHRHAPYAAVTGGVTRRRGVLSGEHLARVVFGVDESPGRLVLPGAVCQRIYVAAAAAKFDWCQYVVADEDGYDVRADYATDLFTAEQAAQTLDQWRTTIDVLTSDPATTVSALGHRLTGLG